MRIACLYFPTSSVGGIASDLLNLRSCAMRHGHTWDVLRSGDHSTIEATRFKNRKLIRGGDSFIHIDGEAPHSPRQAKWTADYLNRRYDLVVLAFLCPHPKKDYPEPVFLQLLERLTIPVVGRVTDGYFETYAEWGERTLAFCQRMTVGNSPTYAQPLIDRGITRFEIHRSPFDAEAYELAGLPPRSVEPLTVWPNQQKNIKGWDYFLDILAEIPGSVDIYNCGIRYYQTRTSAEWKRGVGANLFHPEFGGEGRATYHGWIPMDTIRREVLPRAWCMVDFQGMGRPKYGAYRTGSYNTTTVEALWYGALPVLFHTAGNAGLSSQVYFGVEDAHDLIDHWESVVEQFRDPQRVEAARQHVLDVHSAEKQLRYLLGEPV